MGRKRASDQNTSRLLMQNSGIPDLLRDGDWHSSTQRGFAAKGDALSRRAPTQETSTDSLLASVDLGVNKHGLKAK